MDSVEKYVRSRMSRKEPFQVPEGYFDNLVGEIMAKLPEQKELDGAGQTDSRKVVPLTPSLYARLRPVLYVAACLLVAVLSFAVYFADSDEKEGQQVAAQYSYKDASIDEVADYMMADNSDIYACLTNDY
jgi:hypothetical protein